MRVFRVLPSSLLPLLLSLSTLTHADVSRSDEAEPDTADDGLRIEHTAGPTSCARPTQQGDTIAVHYRGRLQANGEEFDASYRRGKPLTFVLGVGRVIPGWDEGLLGMCVGEARTLTIPPALAYGSGGTGPIPPDSTLVFETRLEALVAVAPGSEAMATTSTSTSTPTLTSSSATDAAAFSIATAPSTPPHEDVEMEDAEQEEAQAEEEEETWETMEDAALEEADAQVPAEIVVPATSEVEQGECKLLGPFALLVQGALGALALLTLVWKRWREEPKRPWKIFCFDVSKQVLGSMLTHVINLAMSMVGSGDIQNAAANAVSQGGEAVLDAAGHTPNPCSFYLLNLGIDTTIGVPVLYVLLKILSALFLYTPLARPPQSIKSGNYGTPPRTSWYGKQLLIYCIGLVGMKLFVFFLFLALPWLPWIGDWALRWTKGNEALEITFALFIFPLAMNAVQYWVIDNFIMDKQTGDLGYEQVAEDDADEERQRALDDDAGLADENDALTVGKSASSSQSRGMEGDGRDPRSDRSKLA